MSGRKAQLPVGMCSAITLVESIVIALSCVVLAVRRCKGGDGGAERSRGGRLFEVTEIATTDDKMPMEEMLKNIAWCSTGVLQTETFEMFQPMYGSTDRCSSARSP